MYVAKLFKCHNYKNIEERIGTVLMQFKDKPNSRKEMIHLRYNLLVEITDFICDNYDREVEYINAHCQRYLAETIESDGFIPEMINLDEYMQDYLLSLLAPLRTVISCFARREMSLSKPVNQNSASSYPIVLIWNTPPPDFGS